MNGGIETVSADGFASTIGRVTDGPLTWVKRTDKTDAGSNPEPLIVRRENGGALVVLSESMCGTFAGVGVGGVGAGVDVRAPPPQEVTTRASAANRLKSDIFIWGLSASTCSR
jgi:hypothetical protein